MNDLENVSMKDRIRQLILKNSDVEVELELYGKEGSAIVGNPKELGSDYVGLFRIVEVESKVMENEQETTIVNKYYVSTLIKLDDIRAFSIVEPVKVG
jgi:hypothetical protein